MINRIEGRVSYFDEDEELQRRIKALIKPYHYSYDVISRVGRDFLRKYSYLLGDDKSTSTSTNKEDFSTRI